MSRCSSCGFVGETSDFPKGNRSDGASAYCFPCKRDYAKRWRAKNLEKEIQRDRRYKVANRLTVNESARRRMTEKRLLDPVASNGYTREYRRKNKGKAAVWDAKKRAARLGAHNDGSVTDEAWERLKDLYKQCCAYCLKPSDKLQRDHIIPLSKGGSHAIENIAPACPGCNNSKNAKDVHTWVMEKHGRLL